MSVSSPLVSTAPTVQGLRDLLAGLGDGASSSWCQRWADHQMSWCHADEGELDTRGFFVDEIREVEAQLFCAEHHYASSALPAAVRSYGLIESATRRLVGVVVLGGRPLQKVLSVAFPTLEPLRESAVLDRLVCLDSVPARAEAFFLGQVFDQARQVGLRGMVFFADTEPRRDRVTGQLIVPGHVGCAYEALGDVLTYTGRVGPRDRNVMADGSVFDDQMLRMIRCQGKGHALAETRLLGAGARPRRLDQDLNEWLRSALVDAGVRRIRHHGLHRYLCRLGTAEERCQIPLGHAAVGRDLSPLGAQP